MQNESSQYTPAEEVLHATTHGVGVLLSIFGLSWMLYITIPTADPWRIVASVVYGSSLIALFLASTIYHSLYRSPHKGLYQLLDHCAIYLLIAGTYTPFVLVAMRNSTGWWLFGTIWTMAAAGVLTRLWSRRRFPRLTFASYLVMGWLVVLAGPKIAQAIGSSGMGWLVAGGLSYTAGAFFYALDRLSWNHAIWHVFVLAGGACHFLTIVRYVLPSGVGATL